MIADGWPRNATVRRWFDRGRVVDALIGIPPCLVIDRHWGGHDRPLVIRQLAMWADDHGHRERLENWLLEALEQLAASGELTALLRLARDWKLRSSELDLPVPTVASIARAGELAATMASAEERTEASRLAPHVADAYGCGHAELVPSLEPPPPASTTG